MQRKQRQSKTKLLPGGPSSSPRWPIILLALAALRAINDGGDAVPTRRRMSLDADDDGGGGCDPEPPAPDSLRIRRTVVVGFPSGDNRMVAERMEALTGLPAKEDWDFEFLGDVSNDRPIIMANYPHRDGIWSWGKTTTNATDRVVLMVPHIRRSMVEYGAKIWEDVKPSKADGGAPPMEEFYAWRDSKVIDECRRYGWFIDYWMEGGLMRDVRTHEMTTPEHWHMLMAPAHRTRDELDYDLVFRDRIVAPSYDPHCAGRGGTNACVPASVISAERLRDHARGPAETVAMAKLIINDGGNHAITREAWDCVLEKLRQNNGEGPNGEGPNAEEKEYNFSPKILEEMTRELDRLVSKYGGAEWSAVPAAGRMVGILVEHRASIRVEANEISAGVRKLAERDFLGPNHRARQSMPKDRGNDYLDRFDELEHRARKRRWTNLPRAPMRGSTWMS